MIHEVQIEQLAVIGDEIDQLSELLVQVVNDGASIGFLPAMPLAEATKYWQNVINPDVILYVAKINNQIVGSVQLHLCSKQNGTHRAEIAKLITHPAYRRRGIARSLMRQAHADAERQGRSLLVLDTREGDPSNDLYRSMGYIQAGRIPDYAQSASGELDATVIYYKKTAAV